METQKLTVRLPVDDIFFSRDTGAIRGVDRPDRICILGCFTGTVLGLLLWVLAAVVLIVPILLRRRTRKFPETAVGDEPG